MVSDEMTVMVAGALMRVVSTLPAVTTTVSSRLMVCSCSLWGDGEEVGLGSWAAAAAAHKRPRLTAGINPFITSSLLGGEASTRAWHLGRGTNATHDAPVNVTEGAGGDRRSYTTAEPLAPGFNGPVERARPR